MDTYWLKKKETLSSDVNAIHKVCNETIIRDPRPTVPSLISSYAYTICKQVGPCLHQNLKRKKMKQSKKLAF